MKNKLQVIIRTFLFFMLACQFITVKAEPQFGNAMLFNHGWKFILQDVKDGASPNLNDSKWSNVTLPHDWSVKGLYSPDNPSCSGYLPGGIGWYRKTFMMPSSDKTKKVFIYFGGVYEKSEVFINGVMVGKRPNGFISFMYDLTPYIHFGAENTLAVRVDHSQNMDSRWYAGSGIYRNVFLVTSSKIHIGLWGEYFRTLSVDSKSAELNLQTTIQNQSNANARIEVINQVVDPKTGKTLAFSTRKILVKTGEKIPVSQTVKVRHPKLWSVDTPNLYNIKTILKHKGEIIDSNVQEFGIRTLKFDPNKGFALNGKWMKIKGVCIHQDAGSLGDAVPRQVWRRRLDTLKVMGCNAIRMSHNPESAELYELCDEMGFLVMDEAFDEWKYPKKKWIKGWNVGKPAYEGESSYFKEWSDRDLSDLVLRDRNYPCVFMWSIGNEVDYPNDPYTLPVLDHAHINQPMYGGYLKNHPSAKELGVIAKRLAADVRRLDTTRPVTAALAGVVMSNETDYPAQLDVVGYNYTEDRYRMDHKKYPKRVIYGSETGQTYNAWKAVRDNKYIFGQFIWTGIDYLGESGRWPSRGLNTGCLDLAGFMKPSGHFRQALWSEKPVTYIGTMKMVNQQRWRGRKRNFLSMNALPTWNYNIGDTIRVLCYTNTPQSRLMLNGKQVGEIKPFDDKTGIIYWDIPYAPGKLEVEGLDNIGKITCRYSITTSGRPYAIKLIPDSTVIAKNGGVAQVVAQIVDNKGTHVILSDDDVTCHIKGPAQLLSMETGNNTDMGNYNDNRQRVYHGRLIAYIRATGNAGDIHLTFTAPWLKEAKLTIKAVEK